MVFSICIGDSMVTVYPVRITGITISNFKNVEYGRLNLACDKDDYNASILGLYGQNGSGKTALIDVMELLKNCLCGTVIDSRYADYININAGISTVCIDFSLRNGTERIPVSYEFSIKAGSDDSQQNTGMISDIEWKKTVIISDEIIRCPIVAGSGAKKGRMMDTSSDIFSPLSKKILLVGRDSNIDTDLIVAKKLAKAQSRSFLFSRELLSLIRRRAELKSGNAAEQKESDYYISVLESLVNFGNHGLFVINTATSGLISLDTQPISFKYSEGNMGALGTIMLSLDRSQLIPKHGLEIVKKVIGNMNTVLCRIVPGLTVGIKELGTEVMSDGNIGCRIQLMSEKNSKEIPLKYESEGIKKIISILQLLIVIYNQDSITVAIDELDSGVFEYLLGEILRIISEKGKGQLIFTSHNLRPLETLDKSFIAFTTNNPRNRYVRMQNVKENNNLRDFYYRSITLGTQKEELYEPTKNADIAFAFREAGVNGCK